MDNINIKEEANQSSVEKVIEPTVEKNINQQELKEIYQKIGNSKYQSFEKTTLWNNGAANDEFRPKSSNKETLDCLLRIESKLIKIERLLEK